MSKLLFHRVGLAETSPFDEAIVSVVKDNQVKVVSPYIGLRYFQRLVALSSDWRLISDIEAWLSSLAIQERVLSTQFIQDNCERIHHFPAIHAKTVIGRATAYLGSANLTSAGIQTRTEMGVLVDEPAMIADLHSWFDELWHATSMPVMAEVLAYSCGLDLESREQTPKVARKSLSFDGEQVRARLMRLSDAQSDAVTPQVVSKSPSIERNTEWKIVEVSQATEASSQLETDYLDPTPVKSSIHGEYVLQPIVAKSVLIPLRTAELAVMSAKVAEKMEFLGKKPFEEASLSHISNVPSYLPRDLEDAVRVLIEKLANSGFTFKELLLHIRRSCVNFRTCAVYLELTHYCANLPRSVFATDTINRLIYKNGFFRQSTAFDVATSLAQHDAFLAALIELISFGSTMPVHSRIEAFLSIRQVWIRRWLYDLKQSGILIEFNATKKDLPGNYKLNEEFKWSGRWRLFEQARLAWDVKLKSYRSLASLTTAVISNGRLGETGNDVAEGSDKSAIASQATPASSQGPRQSVYARTPMEKRLPPIMATTVSFGPKPTTFTQEKASVNFIKYRADKVYFALFQRLAKSGDPGVISREYLQLVHQLSKEAGEPVDFVCQVLEGKIYPVAAKVVALKGKCSVSALLNDAAAYPRTSTFLRSTLGKEKRKLVQPSNAQRKPKVHPPKRATLLDKSSPITASKNRLTANMMHEGDNAASSQLPEMAAYMQRVADIFKHPIS